MSDTECTETTGNGISRRSALIGAAAAGTAAWAAPAITGIQRAAALGSGLTFPFAAPAIWLRHDQGMVLDPADNTTLLRWLDASGNGHHAETNTAARPDGRPVGAGTRPVQSTVTNSNTFQSLHVVRFDGADDFLRIDFDLNPLVHPNLTVLSISRYEQSGAPLRKVYSHDDSGYDRTIGRDQRVGTGGPNGIANFTAFGGPTTGNIPYGPNKIDTPNLAIERWTPTTLNGRINFVQELSNVAVDSGPGLPYFYLGSNPSFGEYWEGEIYEFILWDRLLSDAEVAQVEAYLDGEIDGIGQPG